MDGDPTRKLNPYIPAGLAVSEIRMLSLDLSQTLVDIRSRRYEVWAAILGEAAAPDLADVCWREADREFVRYFAEVADGRCPDGPTSVKEVFRVCYRRLFDRLGLELEPDAAARCLAQEHMRAVLFPDVVEFMAGVGHRFRLALVSDMDRDMVDEMLAINGLSSRFELVIISEESGCFKCDPRGLMFARLLDESGLAPGEILHIGDSTADVLGAGRAGIWTCWINRYGGKWSREPEPDITVSDLRQLLDLLGVLHGS